MNRQFGPAYETSHNESINQPTDLSPIKPENLRSRLHARVILAEDCPESQLLLSEMLEDLGLSVTVVDDGKACVELAMMALEVGNPYDMIIVDVYLPKLSGHRVARALRSGGYLLPIVAISSESTIVNRRASIMAGCNAFLAKHTLGEKIVPILKQVMT